VGDEVRRELRDVFTLIARNLGVGRKQRLSYVGFTYSGGYQPLSAMICAPAKASDLALSDDSVPTWPNL
jgi:hypothetical protein